MALDEVLVDEIAGALVRCRDGPFRVKGLDCGDGVSVVHWGLEVSQFPSPLQKT